MKCNFWILNSKNTFEEMKGKVEYGIATIGDMSYIVDDLEPFTVVKHGLFKNKGMKYYLLDWKTLKPLKLDEKNHRLTYDKIDPKVLQRIAENKLLFGLLRKKSKLPEGSNAVIKYLTIGLFAGVFVMYFLVASGLFHVGGV